MPSPLPQAAYAIAPFFAPWVFPPATVAAAQSVCHAANPPGPLPAGDLPAVECLLGGWGFPRLDEVMLERLPALRAVFYAGGSIRYFMTDAAWDRGIVVSTAAEENNAAVAEYCAGTILFSLKHGWRLARQVRETRSFPGQHAIPGIYGSRVGLVSFGRIARQLCAHLRGYPLEVCVYDPHVPRGEITSAGATPLALETLFQTCDVVSLHTPHRPETEKLIGARLLEQLRPGATLVNTSRGAIVDEPALVALLARRPDVTAVLDVTDPEPPAEDSPLFSLPNVVLTPHLAGCYGPECRRLGHFALAELERWRAGQPLRGQITRAQAAFLA